MRARRLRIPIIALVVLLVAGGAWAQAAAKRPITHDVYDAWKSIQGTKLSGDGVWLAYALVPQDGDGELVVRNLKTNAEVRAPRGRDPQITSDNRFVVFALAPYKSDTDKARKAKKKPDEMPKAGVGWINLASGKVTIAADHVKSFRVPEEAPKAVVYLTAEPFDLTPIRGEPPKKPKKPIGTDLVIKELESGAQTTIAEVSDFAISKNGAWLAYGVTSKTPAKDGAFARPLAGSTRKTLLTGEGNYKSFAFDGDGKQAAFISDRDEFKSTTRLYKLYHWTTAAETAAEMPVPVNASLTVSEWGRVEFSKDGSRLFFGTASPRADAEPNPDAIQVDIWHYKDPELQPMQKVRADEERKRNFRAVISIADLKFAQLASADMPDVRTNDNAERALGISDVPYQQLISWDGDYDDYYAVKLADGSRQKVLTKARFQAWLSPSGRLVLAFDQHDNAWYAIKTTDGQKVNLTGTLGVKFQSETDDHPDFAQPYGVAGWVDGEKAVLLYDRYDIWSVATDGSGGRMITNGLGRKSEIVFRYSRTEATQEPSEPSEEGGPRQRRPDPPAVSSTRPILLSATDDRTKATGLYRVTIGGTADPQKVVMMDKQLGVPLKARDADVYAFTESRFDEFPNVWISSGAFSDMKKVTDANPQQANYLWGTSELVEYVNADGRHLKAILTKPENFDPNKKYPMLVYIYEQLSQNLHRYVPPRPEGSSINVVRYVSNGYIILQPDIVYDIGYPGQSALKCVLPAVQRVMSMGFVDPQRVGIQGHSWGGYQIAYMITHTNIFRAVEAGAAVDDMFGAYGGIRWGTGMSRAFQYERTQSRIGVPPWENPAIYMENSPLFWIEKIHTPYLTMANDEDDAVPWQQGIQFFTAMRRLGKEAYMFVYNGEKHGLRQRENQKHWTVHMAEYFDYFFLGAPKPDWMEHGVPYLEKGKRDVSPLFKKTNDGR